jgi:hypothetical protein
MAGYGNPFVFSNAPLLGPPHELVARAPRVGTHSGRRCDSNSECLSHIKCGRECGYRPRGQWQYENMNIRDVEHDEESANGREVVNEVAQSVCWRWTESDQAPPCKRRGKSTAGISS